MTTPSHTSAGGPSGSQADSQPTQDPHELRKALETAEDLKQEGNDHFRAKRWDEALIAYQSALGHLPHRPQPVRADPQIEGGNDGTQEDETDSTQLEPTASTSEIAPPTEIEIECAKIRAVLYANIGACHLKLGEPKEVVTACSEALKDDPKYIKALQRRATANEQIDSWSSLSAAQEDYKTLLELLPTSSADVPGIKRSLAAIGPLVEAAQKRETGEMLDKLKGLGNSILGNFGLSTDNFQFVPNGAGGYSMNFVQNPS